MRKITYVLLCLLLSVGVSWAQSAKITGTVTSAEDNEPVIGASIVVKGTTIGTVTNFDGTFELDVPENAKTLVFSYIGMKAKEVTAQTNMKVTLESDSKALDEVVVTAMGLTREKKSLGYAIQEVKSDELTKAGQMSLTSSLSGKMAGVQINQFGGGVGASSRISIRGNSSLGYDQQPMIVVDGIPIANDTQRTGDHAYTGVDYGSGLNDINPEDIESITVLKGGSAALYGMRAGNGVILITTKSGRKGEGVKVSYDGSITMDRISTIPKLQNSYGQGKKGSEYYWQRDFPNMSYQDYVLDHSFSYLDGSNGTNDFEDVSWGPRLDANLMIPQYDSPIGADGKRTKTPWVSNPNNIKDFFQTGYSMNHTVSVQANSEKSSTRASLSFRDQKGTVPNTDQKRYSGQIGTDIKISKQVSFDLNASYTRAESDNLLGQGYAGNNPINGLFVWSGRQINMKTLKANWDQRDDQGNYTMYNWNNNYHLNPYFNIYKNTNSYQRDRIFAKSSLFYQPFEYLKFEGRVGIDYYNAQIFERHYKDYSDFPDGGFDQNNSKNTELNLDFIASFNKRFNEFNLSAMAGANYRNVNWEETLLGAPNLTILGVYTVANTKGNVNATMDHSHIRSNSVYGSASLGWRDQLYLDVSARNDWSSTINKSFFYPSFSASWIATESFEWLKGDVFSFLKLRGVWAEIGAATSAYKNRAYYYATDNAFNGVPQMYKSNVYPNENLKPESIRTWELGLDVGFFNDRLHADVAYYQKNTKDQIMTVATSNVVGFSSMLLNAGEIENKGIEVQLRGDILRNAGGLNWTSTLNFSKDKSKIIELYPELGIKEYRIGWSWGISTMAQEGKAWGTLVGTGYDRTEDGAIKVTEGGLLARKASTEIGNVTPDFLSGWRNEFSYKNFSLSFLLDLRIGGDIWSQSMNHSYVAGTAEETVKNGVREHAVVAGRNVMTDERFVMQDANGDWVPNTIETSAELWFDNAPNETHVFDGSFLKLREASLTYVVPKSFLQKTRYISNATISLVGSNLALLWVHKSNTLRLDPETGGVSSDSRGVGFEQASIPTSRSFGLKLGLTF